MHHHLYSNHARDINVFVRVGDYVAPGGGVGCNWFCNETNKHYECKAQMLGPDGGDEMRAQVLDRIVISTPRRACNEVSWSERCESIIATSNQD